MCPLFAPELTVFAGSPMTGLWLIFGVRTLVLGAAGVSSVPEDLNLVVGSDLQAAVSTVFSVL